MFDMSANEDKSLKERGIVTAFKGNQLEVGVHHHRFRWWITPSTKWLDTIWVVMDKLTKSVHFIPIWLNYSMDKLSKLYIWEIV